MANKTFQGRIVQKHDTKTNWDKATNFIPLKGEIIVYDDLNKIKIGDGTTKVGNLAFVNDLDTLATVAKTGSYNDLTDKPTIPEIPTKVSAFENDKGYLTDDDNLNYKNIINDPYHLQPLSESECYIISGSAIKADAIKLDIANFPSFLLNQKNYYFYFDNQNISMHYLLLYNGTTKIKQIYITSVKYINVQVRKLDTNGNPETIFIMVVSTTGTSTIGYSYTVSTNTWTEYPYLNTKLSNYTLKTDLSTVATSGNYNDLSNKPTKVSEFTNDANYATQTDLTNATAGITGAMHFIGTSTTAITDHGTENPTIDGTAITTKTAGDTVIYNHLEFVWDGAKWEKLGDEGSYVLKTQKINGKALSGDVDLTADDVDALPITGGTLKGDLEIPQSYKLTLNNAFIKGSTSGNTIYLNVTNAMGRNTIITGIETPDQKYAAANKEYVDTEINTVKEAIPTKISDLENDEELYVNITYSNSTYTADKTFSEIITASNNNKKVYVIYSKILYPLTRVTQQAIQFETTFGTNHYTFIMTVSNAISYQNYIIQTNNLTNTIDSTSTSSAYPSAKAVYNYVQSAMPTTTIITWTDDET